MLQCINHNRSIDSLSDGTLEAKRKGDYLLGHQAMEMEVASPKSGFRIVSGLVGLLPTRRSPLVIDARDLPLLTSSLHAPAILYRNESGGPRQS